MPSPPEVAPPPPLGGPLVAMFSVATTAATFGSFISFRCPCLTPFKVFLLFHYQIRLPWASFLVAAYPATLEMAAGGGAEVGGMPDAVTSARCVSAGGGRRESLASAWG